MRATCPDCGTQGHVSAFFVEDDAKRLLATVVDLPAPLQRPVLDYLSLFKPARTALQLKRAQKLVDELRGLVTAGTVCRDERGGVRREATAAMWAAGIEQMLAQRAALTLPLSSHHYLRAVVFGIADSADAAAERQTEAARRAGKHLGAKPVKSGGESPLQNQLRWIEQTLDVGGFTPEEAEAERAKARAKYGGANG